MWPPDVFRLIATWLENRSDQEPGHEELLVPLFTRQVDALGLFLRWDESSPAVFVPGSVAAAGGGGSPPPPLQPAGTSHAPKRKDSNPL